MIKEEAFSENLKKSWKTTAVTISHATNNVMDGEGWWHVFSFRFIEPNFYMVGIGTEAEAYR